MTARLLDNIVQALFAGGRNAARHSGGLIEMVSLDLHLDDRHDGALEAFSALVTRYPDDVKLSRQTHGAKSQPIATFSEPPVDLTVYGPELATHNASGVALDVLNMIAAAEAAGGKE